MIVVVVVIIIVVQHFDLPYKSVKLKKSKKRLTSNQAASELGCISTVRMPVGPRSMLVPLVGNEMVLVKVPLTGAVAWRIWRGAEKAKGTSAKVDRAEMSIMFDCSGCV